MTTVPLKYVSTLTAGQAPSSELVEPFDEGFPFLQGNAEFGQHNPKPRLQCPSPSKRALPGDVLLSVRAPVGAINVADQAFGIGRGLCAIRALSCEPRFLRWWLRTQIGILDSVATGSTYAAVTAEDVADLRFPVISLEKQRRIADFLDAETQRIDSLAHIRSRQVELLRERTYAHWDSRIRADGDEHGWVPLRRFLQSITDGPFGSSLTSSHYADEGARVIRLGNVARASFRNDDAAFIPLDYYPKLRRHEARPGDLIVAGLGDDDHPLGRSCVVPESIGPAIVKADCFRLRLDQSRLTHAYAAWALSSPPVADEVFHLSRGSTRRRINTAVAREIQLPIPPVDAQQDTVNELTGIRRTHQVIEERCNDQLDSLAERRQALITAAMTGEIDVTTTRPKHDAL